MTSVANSCAVIAVFAIAGCGGMPLSSDTLPTGDDLKVWVTETARSQIEANCRAFPGAENLTIFSEKLGDPCGWGQAVMAELVVDCPQELPRGSVGDVLDAAFAFSCAFAAAEFDRKGGMITLDSVTDAGFTVTAQLRRGPQ